MPTRSPQFSGVPLIEAETALVVYQVTSAVLEDCIVAVIWAVGAEDPPPPCPRSIDASLDGEP